MKLSCEVTQDLLPLYHDGVCSAESRALVEDHVADCPDCTAILRELRGEIKLTHEEPDDGAVLKKLRKNVKRAWLRGAAAVLAVVMLALAGRCGWWYANDYCYYQQFVQGYEPIGAESGAHTYSWDSGRYKFTVHVSRYPGEQGMVTVFRSLGDMPKNIVPGREVEVYLYPGREDYAYQLVLTVTTRTAVAGQAHLISETTHEYLVLDAELNPIPEGIYDQKTHDRQAWVLEEYHTEIMDTIEAAQSEWPFLKE